MAGNLKITVVILSFMLFVGNSYSQQNKPSFPFTQQPNDDLGDVEDTYQEHFFEALKQRGIENYKRSNDEFLKCLEIKASEPVVFFELGKNYGALKNYETAKVYFKKAKAALPNNEWILDELFNIYYKLNDFENALQTIKQLVEFHPDYEEDLASVYIDLKQYNNGLNVLDKLDKKHGKSKRRDSMRNIIYDATGNNDARIENLKQRIANYPKDENAYLKLIYWYSKTGNKDKAYDAAQQLLKQVPKSQQVHLALYKFYLEDKKYDEAITSMKIVIASTNIQPKAKAKVLNDFVNFTKAHPKYESELLEATTDTLKDASGKSDTELANYYKDKGDKVSALKRYEEAYKKDLSNFEALKNIIVLHIDLKAYKKAAIRATEGLENFPSQPILYLLNGIAQNKVLQYNAAIGYLEEGVDYIIDDTTMEIDFYKQLAIAYTGLNDIKKAEQYTKKAQQLRK